MNTSQFQIMNRHLRGFIRRLYRDDRGNAMMIMAASIAVLVAFAGCAIDGARLYLVNTRLQQACDAGVLAGRKTMVDTSLTNTTLDSTATAAANSFFTNNFRAGWFGTNSVTFTPSKTSQAQVAGVASATVPMTIMKFWGISNYNVAVNCQAEFDVADTDIMFVLDTTGSMACQPTEANSCGITATTFTRPADGTASGNDSVPGYPGSTAYYTPEHTGSRMSALRTALLSFYDTLAASSQTTTHIRYGFVTYTSTVNAGKALLEVAPQALVGGTGSGTNSWTYQSRTQTGSSYGTPTWSYQPVTQNVSSYITSAGVNDPTKSPTVNSKWTGCVEAPSTTAGVTSFNQNSLPNDLNPDLVPVSGQTSTQWKPAWQDAIYYRNWNSSTGTPQDSTSNASSTGDNQTNDPALMGLYPNFSFTLPSYGWVSCGKPVSRLQVMTRTQVSNYVNAADFTPMGGTYHDTGMIWGLRMISPTGLFAADTAAWPGRQPPNRVIVYMTDGVMAPAYYLYGMYGVELYDQRISGTLPSSTEMSTPTNLTAFHNARFLAECAAAKARNINIFTVTIATTANANMTACATTPSQALLTSTGSGINAAFVAIAQQVAMLRLSK